MSRVASFDNSRRRRDVENDLDNNLDRYSLTKGKQIFEDSPNKSEMDQFGDFSGSHSHFDPSGSIERGMANLEKSTDFSFKSKHAMPPMSTLSSLSSHTDSPRKTQSEGGRQASFSRFSPMSARKVTALGMHESESDYSPSKYYQPARTPHAASRMNAQPARKVSPKSFKNTTMLFNELGLDDSRVPAQSFRLPREMPDLTGLLNSARRLGHKEIETIPVSEDNQKLFAALQDLQGTIEGLERQNRDANEQVRKLKEQVRQTEEKLKGEQQRSKYAEIELKQQLSNPKSDGKALEARNETLANAVNATKKELENRTLELDLAREEMGNIEQERNAAIERLANALENVERLQKENDQLRAQVLDLNDKLAKSIKNSAGDRVEDQLRRAAKKNISVEKAAAAVQSRDKEEAEEEEEVTDEAIEVSKSVINESEIEELTREIEALRRKKAKSRKAKQVAVAAAAAKAAAKLVTSRKTSTASAKSKSKPVKSSYASEEETERRKARTFIPVLESSEEELSDTSSADYEADVTATDDEPSQILYRRKPSQKRTSVNVQKVISELSRHDTAKCSICSKKSAKANKSQKPSVVDDANATIRPSQPPVEALTSVLSGLEDEFRHLKIKYHALTSDYNSVSPSLGKRQRKAIAADLKSVIEALEAKADQIYAIFDVLEVAGGDIPLDEYQFNTGVYEPPSAAAKAAAEQTTRRQWINT